MTCRSLEVASGLRLMKNMTKIAIFLFSFRAKLSTSHLITTHRGTSMKSMEKVRPRGGARGVSSATTADVEMLLPTSEAPLGDTHTTRARTSAPVVETNVLTRLGDIADAHFPHPPRPGDYHDRRRVWTWAIVCTVLTVLMFTLVASKGGSVHPERTTERSLESIHEKQQRADNVYGASSDVVPSTPEARIDFEQAPADHTSPEHLENAEKGHEAVVELSDATSALTSNMNVFSGDSISEIANAAVSGAQKLNELTGNVTVPIPRTPGTCVTSTIEVPAFTQVDQIEPEEGWPQNWREFADTLKDDAKNSDSNSLILVGDSITEAWRGTSLGNTRQEYAAAPGILEKRLGHLNPLALAISGDTCGNVLWRLRNQGFPDNNDNVQYVTLLIGTNDLSRSIRNVEGGLYASGCASDDDMETLLSQGVPAAVSGIVSIVEELRRLTSPEVKIVVLGLTPRGEQGSHLQPSIWTGAVERVNKQVTKIIENGKEGAGNEAFGGRGSKLYENVVFQECSEPFIVCDASGGGKRVDTELMRDGLHPDGAGGFDALAECLVKGIEQADRLQSLL